MTVARTSASMRTEWLNTSTCVEWCRTDKRFQNQIMQNVMSDGVAHVSASVRTEWLNISTCIKVYDAG